MDDMDDIICALYARASLMSSLHTPGDGARPDFGGLDGARCVAVLQVLPQFGLHLAQFCPFWRNRLGARYGIGGDLVMTWRPTGRSVAPDDAHGSLGGGRVWAVASGGPIGVWLKCIVKRGGRVATADVAFTHTPITTCVFVVSVIPSYQNISPWRQIT